MALDPATTRLLSTRLGVEQATHRLPSVSAGVVRGGELVWADARGTLDGRASGVPADADTQYRMGSITKTFVAVAVMRLRDAGRLDLDDPLDEHVPGTAFGRATVAQLLTHTSGLQSETDGPWWERTPGGDWDALVAPSPVQRMRPASRYHYSNVGYAALGELVARAHGAGWAEVVGRELLTPLGMTRTTTRPNGRAALGLAVHPFADLLLAEPEHDAGAMAPAGQLWTTVQDLARWAAFLAGDVGEILSADTLAEMLVVQAVNDLPGQAWTSGHGLGFQVWNESGRRYAGHGGSMPGFLAGLQVDVETGDGVVLFANTTSAPLTFARDLLTLVREREPLEPPPWSAPDAADPGDVALLDLVGLWHWGPALTHVKATPGGGLEFGVPGQERGARFRPVGDGTWVGLDGYYAGEPLRVVRRADGSVSHLDVASFRFTRTPYDPDADVPGDVDPGGWR